MLLGLIFFLIVAVASAGIPPDLTRDLHKTIKRNLDVSNMAISYASTDFESGSSRYKTITVVKKAGPPPPTDLPENMVRLPSGNTAQYWPADMRSDIKNTIQSPFFMPTDATYGYYTAFMANRSENAPPTFPSPPPDTRPSRPKVISLGSKKETRTGLNNIQPTKFTHWDGLKVGKTSYDHYVAAPQSQKATYEAIPQVQEERTNDTPFQPVAPPCIPKNMYTFSIFPNPKLLPFASALSMGDIRMIKEIARQLQEDPLVPQPNPRPYWNATGTGPLFFPSTTLKPLTFPTTTEKASTASTTTPAPYLAPSKKTPRKRLNRRPGGPRPNLLRTRTTTTEVVADLPSTSPDTTTAAAEVEPAPTQAALQMNPNAKRRRFSRFYIFQ